MSNINIVMTFLNVWLFEATGMVEGRQTGLMERMTEVLSRMLCDPATRAALSAGGEHPGEPFPTFPKPVNKRILCTEY